MRAIAQAKPIRRRRRRFRYRRFHALHLDLAMVLLLTAAGWSLCPSPRTHGRNYRAAPMTVEIRKSGNLNADALLHQPILFAFRSPVGFTDGGVLPCGDCTAEAPLKLPADPTFEIADFMPGFASARRWPGDATVLRARMPEPTLSGEVTAHPTDGPARLLRKAVRGEASDPNVVIPDVSALELRAMAGRAIRIHVTFGRDGGATAAVLSRHSLPADEAAQLERLALTARGPADASCQLVFHVPE